MKNYTDRHGNHWIPEQKPLDRIGAFALILNGDKVLMVKPTGDHDIWELPGGGVDPTKFIDQGLTRELYEEVHISLPDNIELISKVKLPYLYYADDLRECWNYDLRLYVLEFAQAPLFQAGHEIQKAEWKKLKEWNSPWVNAMHRALISQWVRRPGPCQRYEQDYDDVLATQAE